MNRPVVRDASSMNPIEGDAPMHDPLTLETLDRDGAIRELGATAEAVRTGGHTRASFLARGGALVGGGLALGSLPIALAGATGGGLSKTDTKILNYALTLEYLESAFYAPAIQVGRSRRSTSRTRRARTTSSSRRR